MADPKSVPPQNNEPKSLGKTRRGDSLDEAMEHMFGRSTFRQNFSLSNLSGNFGRPVDINARFNENDYKSHRTASHHNYQPLHRLHYRHLRTTDPEETSLSANGLSRDKSSHGEPTTSGNNLIPEAAVARSGDRAGQSAADRHRSIPCLKTQSPLKSALKKRTTFLPTSSSPDLSAGPSKMPEERPLLSKSFIAETIAEAPREEEEQSDGARVKFILGASDMDVAKNRTAEPVEQPRETAAPKIETSAAESQKKTRRSKSSQLSSKCEDLTLRVHQGSDLESKQYSEVLEPEEAVNLPTADIDDLASHRFDNPRGIRRHIIRGHSFASRNRDEPPPEPLLPMKKYDHKPHEVFVQLDELVIDHHNGELIWKETARWIKYEEDIQVSADRWGKPHVSSLSFHSLLKLRECLASGSVLLDEEVVDFDEIIDKIVDGMIDAELLKPDQREDVVKSLLLRHQHGDIRVAYPVLRRSSAACVNLSQRDKSSGGFLKVSSKDGEKNDSPETAVLIPKLNAKGVEILTPQGIRQNLSSEDSLAFDSRIAKRLRPNAEGSIILVGELEMLEQPAVAFIRLSAGHIIPGLLEVLVPVRFLFVLIGPPGSSDMDYHEVGRSIGTLMSNRAFNEAAYQAYERKDLLSAINSFLDESVVLPPGDFEKRSLLPLDEIRRKSIQYRKKGVDIADQLIKGPVRDPLQCTNKWFGGFICDISYRYPLYLSDLKDGINVQCLASTVFIYFAAIAGAIAFGGLYGDKTSQSIGVSETLITTCACGILFSLLSCQPLVILGTTGPVLMFDEILYDACINYNWNFLTIRVYVGIFTALYATIVVAWEGSRFVRHFSRFLQEIYATVIAMMYIFESLLKLYRVFKEHPLQTHYLSTLNSSLEDLNLTTSNPWFESCAENITQVLNEHWIVEYNGTNSTSVYAKAMPNTALLSLILMFGTFYIAYSLRKLRNSKFLFRSARRALGDFGVPIAMTFMVVVDYFINDVYTQKLNVPDGFSPSEPDRGWIITPWPISVTEISVSAVGGLFLFVLLFLETQICELIIGKKERNLKKGTGFHVDMLVVSYVSILCGCIGGPWMCAATVRSISHVSSLTVWSKTHAPGEVPYIVEVKEQRITNFFVSALIGLSVFMAPLLQKVPVAVLFGVFLYMGLSALSGIQLWERIILMLMHPKHHPDHHIFVRDVRTRNMHFYTLLQLALIGVLWLVKSTVLAPAFPFLLIGLIPFHHLLGCCFKGKSLKALEGEEVKEVEEDEPDFYEQIVA